jgi:hypothetical protein
MNSPDTPIYSRLVAESEWTPEMLRPPFDLHEVLAKSYERVMVHAHLRRQIAKRARTKRAVAHSRVVRPRKPLP